MRSEKFSQKSVLGGAILIAVMSAAEFFCFAVMGNMCLINLAVLNTAVLAAAVYKYIFGGRKIKRRIAIKATSIYILLWVILLFLSAQYLENNGGYIAKSSWMAYRQNVNDILENAGIFGTSSALIQMDSIHEWLLDRSDYILQLLFYGGWISIIILLVCMGLLLLLTFKLLGLKNYYIHKHQMVYIAAFSILVLRCLIGSLYSFGILPYPIALPFERTENLITDSIAVGLILMSARENIQVCRGELCRIVSPALFLDEQKQYTVIELWDEDSEEDEIEMGTVIVKSQGKEIMCMAEWVFLDGKDWAVFHPEESEEEGGFILRHKEKNIWEAVKNKDTLRCVAAKYMDENMDGMEEIYEIEDGED